jgi:sulfur carrier protein
MALTLILNGQSRAFETLTQPASLEQLIGELGLKGDRVAVEHNGEIVPRSGWGEMTWSTSLGVGFFWRMVRRASFSYSALWLIINWF